MSLASGDLTTLAAATAYLNAAPSSAVLGGLISRVSRLILGELNRTILVPKIYSQQFNGQGTSSLVLPNWPVIEFTSLYVSGSSFNISPQENDQSSISAPYGYRFQTWNGVPPGEPAVLGLTGGAYYYRGTQNVVATYKAGYQVTGEAATIPASTPFVVAPIAPYGSWATDEGVTYDNGTAMTATSGVPLAGQYQPPAPDAATPRANYIFNIADAGRGVLISYGFIPGEIEQLALDLIAERGAYRTRVGLRSQSLASQEMISYDTSGFTSFIRRALGPYVSVLPPAMGASI